MTKKYIHTFIHLMDDKKQKPEKQTDRQRKTQYEQHQQYSKHISNEQFTELSPGTT